MGARHTHSVTHTHTHTHTPRLAQIYRDAHQIPEKMRKRPCLRRTQRYGCGELSAVSPWLANDRLGSQRKPLRPCLWHGYFGPATPQTVKIGRFFKIICQNSIWNSQKFSVTKLSTALHQVTHRASANFVFSGLFVAAFQLYASFRFHTNCT